MIDIQRILVATDFSQHSETALKYAVAFAQAFHAEVLLCHVLEKPDFLSSFPPVMEGYFPSNLAELHEQHARRECEARLARFQPAKSRILLPHGSPAQEVVAAASAENADLIVVGTHGRSALTHLLLGSVAERIVRLAGCPVLTVRSGEHEFVKP